MILIWIMFVVTLAVVAKLIYDVQQNKKKENESNELCKTEAEFEAKEKFQKLAGIGQPKNEIDPEIWKYIADKVSKEGFPEPDPSFPVTTAKLATIGGDYGDKDPLAQIPLSKVSNEAKQKMAVIAKEDINKQLEKNMEKFASIFPDEVEYTDEYYKKVPIENNPLVNTMSGVAENDQRLGIEFVKPKRKYNKKSKK